MCGDVISRDNSEDISWLESVSCVVLLLLLTAAVAASHLFDFFSFLVWSLGFPIIPRSCAENYPYDASCDPFFFLIISLYLFIIFLN